MGGKIILLCLRIGGEVGENQYVFIFCRKSFGFHTFICRFKQKGQFTKASNTIDLIKPSGEIVEGTLAAWKLVTEGQMLEEDAFSLRVFLETMAANQRSERYEWNDKDDTLPEGWKSRFSNQKMFILSPDCQVFQSRKAGLQYMIKEHFEKDEIATMRGLLEKHEGWSSSENLPKLWEFKFSTCKTKSDINFVTEEGIELGSYSLASDHIRDSERYTEEEENRFAIFTEEYSQTNRLLLYNWNEKDESLPEGWRSRVAEGNTDRQFFLSPNHQQFTQRSAILKHMVEAGSYSEMHLDLARKGLGLQGWEQHPALPAGWRFKRRGQFSKSSDTLSLIQPDGEIVEGTNAAWQLVSRGLLPQDETFSLKIFLETLAASQRFEKYKWNEGDKSLPEGWKSRKTGTKQFFLSPDGQMVSSRKAGLRHLVKEDADSKDIEVMRDFLRYEGWKKSSSLPKNWFIRKSKNASHGSSCFLTELGEELKSLRLAMEYLQMLGPASKEDIKRLERLSNGPQKAEKADAGKAVKMVTGGGGDAKEWLEDPSLPLGWKMRLAMQRGVGKMEVFLGPGHRQIYGRAALLDHLLAQPKSVKKPGEVARLAASIDWQTLKPDRRQELQSRVNSALRKAEKSSI